MADEESSGWGWIVFPFFCLCIYFGYELHEQKKRIDDIEMSVALCRLGVSVAKQDHDELSGNVDELESKISDLDSRLDDVESSR